MVIQTRPNTVIDLPSPLRDRATITALATGGFTISYTDQTSDSDPNASGLIFSSTGELIGPSIAANATDVDETGQRRVGLSTGQYVATWIDKPDSASDSDIKATLINPITNDHGPVFTVNIGNTAGSQDSVKVVELAGGRIAFTWRDVASGLSKAANIRFVG